MKIGGVVIGIALWFWTIFFVFVCKVIFVMLFLLLKIAFLIVTFFFFFLPHVIGWFVGLFLEAGFFSKSYGLICMETLSKVGLGHCN